LLIQIEEIQNKIVKVTPSSESAKRIMVERAAKQKKDLEFKEWDVRVRKIKIDHKREVICDRLARKNTEL
jgi:hypothetical protein